MNEAPSDRRGVKSLEATIMLEEEPLPLRFTYFHTGREAGWSSSRRPWIAKGTDSRGHALN